MATQLAEPADVRIVPADRDVNAHAGSVTSASARSNATGVTARAGDGAEDASTSRRSASHSPPTQSASGVLQSEPVAASGATAASGEAAVATRHDHAQLAPVPRASLDTAFPVRLAARADAVQCVGTAMRAFAKDPVTNWLAREDEKRASSLAEVLTRGFHDSVAAGTAYTAGPDCAAVAMWYPPGAHPSMPFTSFVRYVGGWRRLPKLLEFSKRITATASKVPPSYYLFILAVEPTLQQHGLGTALVAPMLARADAEGVGCYLENSNPRNLRFYERLGFVAQGNVLGKPGEPVMLAMWRAPPPRIQSQQQQHQHQHAASST